MTTLVRSVSRLADDAAAAVAGDGDAGMDLLTTRRENDDLYLSLSRLCYF